MRPSLAEILVDPESKGPLSINEEETTSDDLVTGTLETSDGRRYPVIDSIPRFVLTDDHGQMQTGDSFSYKWRNEESFGSEGMQRDIYAWLLARYGFESADAMRSFFGSKRRTLDAGCGAGFATAAWMNEDWSHGGAEWVGVDISAAIDVAHRRLGAFPSTHFVQADVLQLPFKPGSFDAIFSEGVLHHTPSTERAFEALVPLLAPGGEIMIYVYKKKGPVREFTDDHVRAQLADLTPEDAWAALRPLTRLGRALAELEVEVDVPDDIPLLGIKAGRYDVQRLVYWNIAKVFWNENMTFEENNHVNFDWYAPVYAHRQTEEDIRRWFRENDLEITRFDRDDAGFTVRGSLA